MSLILVVESEGRHAERVRDGLGSDGWQVEVVSSCEAAVAAVADRAPQLVIVNAELPGAPEMLRSFSRAQGGPGSIALLPEIVGKDLGHLEADESLIKPFTEKDLRQLARRVASSARTPRKSETEVDADPKRLTSHELFGDLLAEVENEVEGVLPAKSPEAAPRPAPAPVAPVAGARSLEMEQRLERTLSGMTKDDRPVAAPPKKASTQIDDMLTRTLSGLDMPKKSIKAATPAAPASPAPAPRPTPARCRPAPQSPRSQSRRHPRRPHHPLRRPRQPRRRSRSSPHAGCGAPARRRRQAPRSHAARGAQTAGHSGDARHGRARGAQAEPGDRPGPAR